MKKGLLGISLVALMALSGCKGSKIDAGEAKTIAGNIKKELRSEVEDLDEFTYTAEVITNNETVSSTYKLDADKKVAYYKVETKSKSATSVEEMYIFEKDSTLYWADAVNKEYSESKAVDGLFERAYSTISDALLVISQTMIDAILTAATLPATEGVEYKFYSSGDDDLYLTEKVDVETTVFGVTVKQESKATVEFKDGILSKAVTDSKITQGEETVTNKTKISVKKSASVSAPSLSSYKKK